jgi:hypothetical protein
MLAIIAFYYCFGYYVGYYLGTIESFSNPLSSRAPAPIVSLILSESCQDIALYSDPRSGI